MSAQVPCKDDLSPYYEPDFLDHNWNKSPNSIDTVNSGANIAGAHFANQEHQNYYDQQGQQYIASKYNGGIEQVTLELAVNIILEEEEEEENRFYQWADQYDQWDTTPYTPITDDDVGGSYTFNVHNPMFNLTKIKRDWTPKTSVVSLSESNNKSDFYIGKRQS